MLEAYERFAINNFIRVLHMLNNEPSFQVQMERIKYKQLN